MSDPSQRAFLDEQPDDWADAARHLADATRELVETVGLTDVDVEALRTARTEVERMTRSLGERTRRHPLRTRPPTARGEDTRGEDTRGEDEDRGPAVGARVSGFVSRPTSPFHPVLPMSFDGERLTASWTASAAHEGPPGHLHGGVSAWHLDALLGTLANLVAAPAVTATLEVRYRRPVPVGVPLRLVGTVARRTERRLVLEGRITAADATCVEGRGVFARAPGSAGSS